MKNYLKRPGVTGYNFADLQTLMKPNPRYLPFLWFVLVSLTNFSPHPLFKQYRANLFKGHKAKIILKSNPMGRMYRTRITDAYYSKIDTRWLRESTGLNFAGHYCFAYWGCGSPCQEAVIVDVKTGLIYDAPPASYGYKFTSTSRLVVVNPDPPGIDCAGCTAEYWVWNDSSKKFKEVH